MSSYYQSLSDTQLAQEATKLEELIRTIADKKFCLDMARGKPNPEQVNLSRPMLDVLNHASDLIDNTVDAANYGYIEGLPSARKLAAEILDVSPEQVLVGDSSSLSIMYDTLQHAYIHGIAGCAPFAQQLARQKELIFLCVCPGYDRHFALTEAFGFTNVPVSLTPDGPDMQQVRQWVEHDEHVKGIWCVPKYANPSGITYSDEVVRAFAALKPAAADFRIYWDNAYCMHDIFEPADELLNIFTALNECGKSNLVYEFASTSKMTFPGSGMAWVAASPDDIAELKAGFSIHRVCPNKLSQLEHVLFLQSKEKIHELMRQHAQFLRPRFELVLTKLQTQLADLGIASWSHPKGGYFISFEGLDNSAKRICALAARLGVKLTAAGACWPYGKDPRDSNIRLAPSYPTLEQLDAALDVFVTCVKYVALQLEQERRADTGTNADAR